MRNCGIVLGIVCAILAPVSAMAGVQVVGGRIVVETDKGRVVFDRGVITEMTNRVTGETYALPGAKADLTGLLWNNAPAWIGPDERLTCEKRGENEAVISAALGEDHQLSMTVAVDPATQDIRIRQSGSGKKKGLSGIQWGIAGLDAARIRTLVPGSSGVCLGPGCPMSEMSFSWPSGWEVQMMVVETGAGGFSVWSEDTEMRFKTLKWKRGRGEVALGFSSQNFAPFDDLTSVESVEWRLAFFKGDWRVPARRYRDWMDKTSALTRLEDQRPGWVKDIRFLVIMGMEKGTLDALKARVRPEATLLYIPTWRRDGYDQNYPDYTACDGFGEFVRYARSLGFHVMPHMNYFGCHEKNPVYQLVRQWHMRSPFTKEPAYWVPPRLRAKKDEEIPQKFAYINPASKVWRDELTRLLVEAQKKYGFDAIHLDQTLGIMNDANGRIDGVYCAEGNVLLHKQLREAMPDVALSGEGLDEVTCRYEAFAQRHAANAVNHVYGTWDDEFIACGHPISSYFLTPYTKIYGYLGMSNPSNRGIYLAWKRAYENWGVIPTFARPSPRQMEAPDDMVTILFREARTWVDDKLSPDFEGQWPPQTEFKLKGKEGATAVYEKDESGGSRMTCAKGGPLAALGTVLGLSRGGQQIYAFIKGRNVVKGAGRIADWCAYDEEKIFGLNPDGAYVYTEEPRDLRAAHICRGPDNVQVRVPARDERKFAAEFEGIAETREYDFIKNIGEAETGVVVDGKSGDLEYGASFQSGMSTCAEVVRRAIFAHPPWKIKPQGPAPARTFGRYTVELPKEVNAFLEFAIGLRDGVDGRSDGAQFRVEIGGESVFDEVWAKSEWKSACLPLEKWRGQKVSVAFITTPGPRGNVSFDWACWGEPRVRFEVPPRRIDVSFACRREVGLVVGSDRGLKWRPARMQERLRVYDVNTEMPGRVVFLWDKPRPVKPPLDLRKEPFTVSISANGAPAAPGEPFVGASVSEVACGGQKRPAIGAHPPNHGRTSVDYLLELPAATPVKLAFAVGLRDGSKSDGVLFIVEANGRELFRRELTHADGWHPAEVDLSAYAGKPLLLSLVVDSDGPFYYDWASWAEPEMR